MCGDRCAPTATDPDNCGGCGNETTGDIEHGWTAMILSERGRIAWRLDGDWHQVRQLLQDGE